MGTYGINNSVFDVFIAVVFALFAPADQARLQPAPLALGILGPMMEENLRRAMRTATRPSS